MSPDAAYWENIVFLALTVWREARGEIYTAKLAVAYSILDRVAHPSWWGSDVMSVVFKRFQYSSLTNAGDPNLVVWPKSTDPSWADSMQASLAATSKTVLNPAIGADSYFDDSISPPNWAKPEMFVATIGRLNFYNLDRDYEQEQLNAARNARTVHTMPTPTPRSNKWYGWIPDYPDHRDKRAAPKAPAGPLPPAVDLRGMMTAMPPYDQGNLGSCTANAAAGAFQFVALKEAFSDRAVPSRLFIYYNERALEGTVDTDAGAQVRDSLKVIALQGSVPETEWPYDITQFAVKPTIQVYDDASVEKRIVYESVFQNRQSIQTVLASGYPVIFGFTVYNSFESETVALTGVVPMPSTGDYIVGGHAVMLVGYDNDAGIYLVRNSWGVDWGKQGYFTIPQQYVEDPNLADDFWVLRAV